MTVAVAPPHETADPYRGELAQARKSGWSKSDLHWERLQEEAGRLYLAGDAGGAAKLWRRAGWISLWRFRKSDPRRATTLANMAFADRLASNEARARRRYAKARAIWTEVDSFIAGMTIARRARSSLFHMRMEAKHWDTYAQNTRIRMTAFARESATALEALEQGKPAACRLYGRWKAEKPGIFDDTRKLLSAALLIAAPAGGEGPPRT